MNENYSIQELLRLVSYSDYIPGEISKAEDYFDKWMEFNKEEAITNLYFLFSAINLKVASSNNESHDLCVILQIFSHMDKEDAYPKGLEIAKNALKYDNNEIQEYALRCFENWEDPNNINLIKSIKFKPAWLQSYADRIVDDLKSIKEKTNVSDEILNNVLEEYWNLTPEELDEKIKKNLNTPLGKTLMFINNEIQENLKEENPLIDYAKNELKKAGFFDKDSDYNGMLGTAVMELIEVFQKQGHSGFSAETCLNIFDKVARFKPLTPLTKDPNEWNEVGENTLQSKRNPSVFWVKGKLKPYTIDDYLFIRENGESFTCNGYGTTYFDLPGFPPERKTIKEGTVKHRQFVEEHYGFDPFNE